MELNDVKLFGRIVRDAELKVMPSGMKIATFSIATNRTHKNEKGEFVRVGNFFPLSVYNQYAENLLPYLVKGQKVIVDGYLKQDKWEKDGEKRTALSIGVKNIQIVFDSKNTAEEKQKELSEVHTERIDQKDEDNVIYESETGFDADFYAESEDIS